MYGDSKFKGATTKGTEGAEALSCRPPQGAVEEGCCSQSWDQRYESLGGQ